MNAEMVQVLITNTVGTALAEQEQRLKSAFTAELESVKTQASAPTVQAPQVEVYQRAVPNPEIKCDVKLDIVKSHPTFNGSHDE